MATKEKALVSIPKDLGACADAYYLAREERLAADKVAADLKKIETALSNHLINTLQKDTTGVSGKVAHVYVGTDEIPVVKDRPKFLAWVWKTKSFHCLTAAISKTSVMEILEDNKKIPGIDTEFIVKLHYSKL